MARDVYHMTVTQPKTFSIDLEAGKTDVVIDDTLLALEGVEVTVVQRGTSTPVQIFQRPTGATEGPTPEAAATGGPNPFNTGPSGSVEFWCDGPAELDVKLHDTIAPARIADRTFGWNATAVGPNSVPSSYLAKDGGIVLASLAAEVKRQLTQIGEVIDWWRPDPSVPLPSGFVLCDGTAVPAGSHDFPIAGAINTPDLRNRFILGADASKALAAGAAQGNTSADAPGIAGTGGSNAAKDFSHGHGVPVPSHTHIVTVPDHYHGAGSLYAPSHSHTFSGKTGSSAEGTINRPTGSGGTMAPPGHTHDYSGTTSGPNATGCGGNTGTSSVGAPAVASSVPSVSLNTATNTLTWNADPGTDMRPRFFGLLKLMKVKYA